MLAGHGLANRGEDAGEIGLFVPLHFLDDDQLLPAGGLHGKRGPAIGSQPRMALLYGPLDILRIVVHAVDDDQVFQTPRDEELTVLQESQVAGAEKGPFAAILQPGAEGAIGGLRLLPVTLGNARAPHPNLPDAAGRTSRLRLRIGNGDLLVGQVSAAADQCPHALVIGIGIDHLAARQSRGVERANHRRGPHVAAGDDQRGLGQAKTGVERLTAKSARGKSLGKGVQSLRPNRLGAVEGHPPTAQVERFLLFGSDFADAKVISEIRPAAGGGAESCDRRQPAVRLLQEAHRRNQDVGPPDVERLQDAANQPHVVIARQPEDARSRAVVLERIGNQGRVVNQIGVVQHDALRRPRRAGCVLQEGQRVAMDVGHAPIPLHLRRHSAGGEPGKLLQMRRFVDQRHNPIQDQVGRQGHPGVRIVGNGLDAIQRAISPGGIHRHRDHSGIDAAEKGRNELQTRRIQQQGPLAHQIV